MTSYESIQLDREDEFCRLFDQFTNDTTLLLFPVRLETHFRKYKVKEHEQCDSLDILIAYKNLIDKLIEQKTLKNPSYNYIPLMSKILDVMETSRFGPYDYDAPPGILDFHKKVFVEFSGAPQRFKYAKYEDAIKKALGNSTDRGRVYIKKCNLSIYAKKKGDKTRDTMGMNRFNSDNTEALKTQTQLAEAINNYKKWLKEAYKKDVHPKKELCIRIYPDEIAFDYLTEKLTEREIADGKLFWLQWFIASGSKQREYEAWQVLCDKYPSTRAAWIVRQLKPVNINDFRPGYPLFYRRPYQKSAEIEKACEEIYKSLAQLEFTETPELMYDSGKDEYDAYMFINTGEYKNEANIRKYIPIIKENLFQIDRDIMLSEFIVDYLYDNIRNTVEYLERRLDFYISIYEKYPGLYGENKRKMEIWDVDFTMLKTFRKEVEEFLKKLLPKRIPLDELIQKYFDEHINKNKKDPNNIFFPKVKVNNSNVPDAPEYHIVPKRFMVICEEKKKKTRSFYYGRRVKEKIHIGFNFKEDIEAKPFNISEKGDLEVSGDMAWMLDYDVAEKSGMAITIPLYKENTEFSYIYVIGIKTGGTKKKYLENLFNSHNYTSRLELLKTCTPTNRIDEATRFYNPDPMEDMRLRYEIEVEDKYLKPTSNTSLQTDLYDSRLLAKYLKISYVDCWGHALHFNNQEIDTSTIANKSLWTHFRKILQPDFKPGGTTALDKQLDFIGEFLSHVKARGVLPSFRIGNQPYGVVPVAEFYGIKKTLEQIQNRYPELYRLCSSLITYADKWKKIRNDWNGVVTSEKMKGNDAERKYMKMAGMTPYSSTLYERQLLDSPLLSKTVYINYLEELKYKGFFDSIPVDGTEKELKFDGDTLQKLVNVVKDGINKEYEERLKKNKFIAVPEITDTEYHLLVSEFFDLFTHRIDAWFTGILNFLLLDKYSTFTAPKQLIGAYGWAFDVKENPRTEITNSVRKKGIIEQMELTKKDEYDELRIYENTTNEYIVAPSVQHALSAAILRSAYLKTMKNAADSHMCVNLSSTRARQALRMIDGIKNGMSTGVILGADLERYLHEAYRYGTVTNGVSDLEMDRYIYPLRKFFPQQPIDLQAANDDERANNYLMQVINGEALLNTFIEEWAYDGTVSAWLGVNYDNSKKAPKFKNWFKQFNTPAMPFKKRTYLFKLFERLMDSYDALNDLLLAESVHRLVQGDKTTYTAINQFMVSGKGNLPEPDILNTPMEHVVVSNKVAIALPECNDTPNRPMCLAEPSVNLWLEQLIGNLDNILFFVGQTNDEEVTKYTSCTLHELDIKPIEYLYLSNNETIFFSYIQARWRLKQNCFKEKIAISKIKPDEYTEEVIRFNAKGEEIENIFTLFEDEMRINYLRSIVMQGNAVKANDLISTTNSDAQDEELLDVKELQSRYEKLRKIISNLYVDMQQCLILDGNPCDDSKLAKMYELLCNCVESGLVNSLPEYNPAMFLYYFDSSIEEKYHTHPIFQTIDFDKGVKLQNSFIEYFAYTLEELSKRITEAQQIVPVNSVFNVTGNVPYLSSQYIEAIQKLILDSFKVFPRFTVESILTKEQKEAYNNMFDKGLDYYTNIDKTGYAAWLSDVAEVREKMKYLHFVDMFQNMCHQNMGKVAILQVNSDGEATLNKWLGTSVDSEDDLQDVDSFVIYNSNVFNKLNTNNPNRATYNAAIMVDAWPEYIPYKKQSAGIVFKNEQPDNEAPQALLLAIHPDFKGYSDSDPSKRWKLDDVKLILEATRFMFMNRAVDPDLIYNDESLSKKFPLLNTITIPKTKK